ncbi:hypothetical protein [Caballeronia arationis]|jgi:hypothetical protein|nr:hypothetical protein [Caballeronia arationis]
MQVFGISPRDGRLIEARATGRLVAEDLHRDAMRLQSGKRQ